MSGDFDTLIAAAEKHNAALDRIDGNQMHRASPRERVRTAMAAVEAGIKFKDWSMVAEGYVLLRDFEEALRDM